MFAVAPHRPPVGSEEARGFLRCGVFLSNGKEGPTDTGNSVAESQSSRAERKKPDQERVHTVPPICVNHPYLHPTPTPRQKMQTRPRDSEHPPRCWDRVWAGGRD